MRYLLVVVLLLLTISTKPLYAQDSGTLIEVPDGNIQVAFDPSPDERTELHILYILRFSDDELFNYHLPLGVNEKSFTSEDLWGGEQYVMYVTAASNTLDDQSADSNRLNLKILGEKKPVPPEKPLPKKPIHIPPKDLKKGN